jgi:hypothetical protein
VRGWSIGLAVASAALALSALGFTAAGYRSVRRQARVRTTWDDVPKMHQIIGQFILGAKLWQTYLALGLTAASVLAGAASNIVGALK